MLPIALMINSKLFTKPSSYYSLSSSHFEVFVSWDTLSRLLLALEIFLVAVPSAWNALLFLSPNYSQSSFRSPLKFVSSFKLSRPLPLCLTHLLLWCFNITDIDQEVTMGQVVCLELGIYIRKKRHSTFLTQLRVLQERQKLSNNPTCKYKIISMKSVMKY